MTLHVLKQSTLVRMVIFPIISDEGNPIHDSDLHDQYTYDFKSKLICQFMCYAMKNQDFC